MQQIDLTTAPVEPHRPVILQSAEGEGRAILIALPAGEALQEHRVQERAYLSVVSGVVEVRAGETVRAGAGGLLVFDPEEDHELLAVEDARLLLILAPWPSPTHRGATRDQRGATPA